ncbi:MAG: hypothetical protein PHE49_02730 [bacterium]|nr:hypothetical protein [bacterium]
MNNKFCYLILIPLIVFGAAGCKRTRNNPYDPLNSTNNGGNGNGSGTTTTGASYRTVLIEEFTSTG